jgi:hypothetical protein
MEAVMAKRHLTSDEKQQIIEKRRGSEQAAHPDARVIVTVDDETDEDGNAVVHVVRTTSAKVMPKDWRP